MARCHTKQPPMRRLWELVAPTVVLVCWLISTSRPGCAAVLRHPTMPVTPAGQDVSLAVDASIQRTRLIRHVTDTQPVRLAPPPVSAVQIISAVVDSRGAEQSDNTATEQLASAKVSDGAFVANDSNSSVSDLLCFCDSAQSPDSVLQAHVSRGIVSACAVNSFHTVEGAARRITAWHLPDLYVAQIEFGEDVSLCKEDRVLADMNMGLHAVLAYLRPQGTNVPGFVADEEVLRQSPVAPLTTGLALYFPVHFFTSPDALLCLRGHEQPLVKVAFPSGSWAHSWMFSTAQAVALVPTLGAVESRQVFPVDGEGFDGGGIRASQDGRTSTELLQNVMLHDGVSVRLLEVSGVTFVAVLLLVLCAAPVVLRPVTPELSGGGNPSLADEEALAEDIGRDEGVDEGVKGVVGAQQTLEGMTEGVTLSCRGRQEVLPWMRIGLFAYGQIGLVLTVSVLVFENHGMEAFSTPALLIPPLICLPMALRFALACARSITCIECAFRGVIVKFDVPRHDWLLIWTVAVGCASVLIVVFEQGRAVSRGQSTWGSVLTTLNLFLLQLRTTSQPLLQQMKEERLAFKMTLPLLMQVGQEGAEKSDTSEESEKPSVGRFVSMQQSRTQDDVGPTGRAPMEVVLLKDVETRLQLTGRVNRPSESAKDDSLGDVNEGGRVPEVISLMRILRGVQQNSEPFVWKENGEGRKSLFRNPFRSSKLHTSLLLGALFAAWAAAGLGSLLLLISFEAPLPAVAQLNVTRGVLVPSGPVAHATRAMTVYTDMSTSVMGVYSTIDPSLARGGRLLTSDAMDSELHLSFLANVEADPATRSSVSVEVVAPNLASSVYSLVTSKVAVAVHTLLVTSRAGNGPPKRQCFLWHQLYNGRVVYVEPGTTGVEWSLSTVDYVVGPGELVDDAQNDLGQHAPVSRRATDGSANLSSVKCRIACDSDMRCVDSQYLDKSICIHVIGSSEQHCEAAHEFGRPSSHLDGGRGLVAYAQQFSVDGRTCATHSDSILCSPMTPGAHGHLHGQMAANDTEALGSTSGLQLHTAARVTSRSEEVQSFSRFWSLRASSPDIMAAGLWISDVPNPTVVWAKVNVHQGKLHFVIPVELLRMGQRAPGDQQFSVSIVVLAEAVGANSLYSSGSPVDWTAVPKEVCQSPQFRLHAGSCGGSSKYSTIVWAELVGDPSEAVLHKLSPVVVNPAGQATAREWKVQLATATGHNVLASRILAYGASETVAVRTVSTAGAAWHVNPENRVQCAALSLSGETFMEAWWSRCIQRVWEDSWCEPLSEPPCEDPGFALNSARADDFFLGRLAAHANATQMLWNALVVAEKVWRDVHMPSLTQQWVDALGCAKEESTQEWMINHRLMSVKAMGYVSGDTPLIVATRKGQTHSVKLLLARMVAADVNAEGHDHHTALLVACHIGNPAIVTLLLNAKADPNLQSGKQITALGEAVRSKSDRSEEVVRALLSQGAVAGRMAFAACPPSLLKSLLEKDMPQLLKDNMIALFDTASTAGNVEVVRLLLKAGVRVDDTCGVRRAVFNGHAELSELLFASGGTASRGKGNRESDMVVMRAVSRHTSMPSLPAVLRHVSHITEARPLCLALAHGEITDAQLQRILDLIVIGAALPSTEHLLESSLACVVRHGSKKATQFLLDAGADPYKPMGARGASGALSTVAFLPHNTLAMAQLLLSSATRMGKEQQMAVLERGTWFSAQRGDVAMLDFYMTAGVPVGMKIPVVGKSLAYVAAEKGHLEYIKRLVEHYHIDVRGDGGRNAVEVALRRGFMSVVLYLASAGAPVVVETSVVPELAMIKPESVAEALKFSLNHGLDAHEQLSTNDILLHVMSRYNQVDATEMLLRRGADVTALDWNGATPLLVAASSGNPAIVQLLLDANSSITATDEDDNTVIMCAAKAGRLEVFKLLLRCSANVFDALTARNWRGETPVDLAASQNQLSIIQWLHNNYPDRLTDMVAAIAMDSKAVQVVRFLADNGVSATDGVNDDGETLLMRGALTGSWESMEVVLARGARLNDVDKHGRTALHHAVYAGHAHVAHQLVDSRAQLTLDKDQWTPLTWVAAQNMTDMVKTLLARESRGLDLRDELAHGGLSALAHAARLKNVDMVRVLCEAEADVLATDFERNSVLHHAVHGGSLEVVALVLAHGARPSSVNLNLSTPIHTAAELQRSDIVQLLLANVLSTSNMATGDYSDTYSLHVARDACEARDNDGRTALALAVDAGDELTINMLVKARCSFDSKDHEQRTVWARAAWRGHCDTLYSHKATQAAEGMAVSMQWAEPMQWAAHGGHEDCALRLFDSISKGSQGLACTAATSSAVDMALRWSAVRGLLRLAEVLLGHNCASSIDKRLTDGETLLSLAAANNHTEVALQLLALKARADTTSMTGSPLLWALFHGNVALSKALYDHGARHLESMLKPGTENVFPITALQLAVRSSSPQLLQLVLDCSGVSIDAVTPIGSTALIEAIQQGVPPELVRMLLAADADPTAENVWGISAVRAAVEAGDVQSVVQLVQHGAHVKEADLYSAALSGQVDAIKWLVSTAKLDPLAVTSKGTALHAAVTSGKFAAAVALLDLGADPNVEDAAGETPLSLAIAGHSEVALLLLAREGNAKAVVDKLTMLMVAAQGECQEDVVAALIKHGADASAQDAIGFTAAMYSCHNPKCKVQWYLPPSYDLEQKDHVEHTVLSHAVMALNVPAVDALLERHADVNAVDQFGRTPLRNAMANWAKYPELARMLIEHGANAASCGWPGKSVAEPAAVEFLAQLVREHEQGQIAGGGSVGNTPAVS